MERFSQALGRWGLPVLASGGFAGLLALFSSAGESLFPAGLLAVVETIAMAGPTALAWLLGAYGLGRVVRFASPHAGASMQLACGIALALFLAHLLGVLGLIRTGPGGAWLAWLPTLLGLTLVGLQIRAARPELRRWSMVPAAALVIIPGVALLIVAACIPPGGIWASEAHGFDARSYHLQLPKEWLAAGRVWPLEHNVYSFLPSYMEAAYTQVAAMMNAAPASAGGPAAGAGWPLLAAQLLHAALAVVTAALVGRLTKRLLGDGESGRAPAMIAAGVFLAIPWVTVTASLAYDEMAVTALLAAALLAATHPALGAGWRGAAAGFMLGVACSCKPTALLMGALPVGVVMLIMTSPKMWARMALAGIAAGLVAMAPWLIRNWMACGNPFFPFVTDFFGMGRWTAEQAQRFHDAHHAHATITERFGLLFAERGLAHEQWSMFPLIVVGALLIALLARSTHRAAAMLAIVLLIQVGAWLCVGHLQSRFLLPMAAPGAAVVALAVAGAPMLARRERRSRAGKVAVVAACVLTLGLGAADARNYLKQNGGRPNMLLVGGVPLLNGSALAGQLPRVPPAEQQKLIAAAPTEAYLNVVLPTLGRGASRVYLLGDSTPLYVAGSVLWNTTWDEWPLLRAMDDAGGDARAAAGKLRQRGVTHVLVNLAEIDRLRRSGYTDPRLTTEYAGAFVRECGGTVIAAWTDEGRGQYLIDIAAAQP